MLPKENRLKKKKDFQKVFSSGEMVQGETVGVLFSKTKDKTRVGIVVSSKVSKKAVERNRVRRAVQESFRKFLPRITQPLDIVVLVKKKILEKSAVEVENDLEQVLKTRKVLR